MGSPQPPGSAHSCPRANLPPDLVKRAIYPTKYSSEGCEVLRLRTASIHCHPNPNPNPRGVGGIRPCQLLSGCQKVKFSSMTFGAVSQCQLLQSCPARCPCQASSGCRKQHLGLGVGLQGCQGRGPRGFRYRIPRQIQGHPQRTLPAVSQKRKPTFPSPTLPPLASCSNRQGHWLEKPRPQPCPSGFVGGGAPACPLPPLPPFLVLQAVNHFPIPTYSQGSRLLGDAHLFWKAISRRGSKMFSSGSHVLYLPSEKGGGAECKKKKKRPGWGMT